MDFTDFLRIMNVKSETCFKKSDHCNCIFASMRLKGQGGFDKIVGSSIPYLCETCFTTIDQNEFEKRINDYEEVVMNLPKNKFIKNEEELHTFFIKNNLDQKKMEENAKNFNEKMNHMSVDTVEFDEKDPSIKLNLSDKKK